MKAEKKDVVVFGDEEKDPSVKRLRKKKDINNAKKTVSKVAEEEANWEKV